MSLPTAHNYVVQNMIESLVALEKNFLKPKLLIENLMKTEKALGESIEVFNSTELSKEMFENDKEGLKLLLEKINYLEKASHEKLNWANQFSVYLQENIKRKFKAIFQNLIHWTKELK